MAEPGCEVGERGGCASVERCVVGTDENVFSCLGCGVYWECAAAAGERGSFGEGDADCVDGFGGRADGLLGDEGEIGFTGEKVVEDKVERLVARLKNLGVSVGVKEIRLQDVGIGLAVPGEWTSCFSLFNIAQYPYSICIRYGVRVATEWVKGTITDKPLDLVPGVHQPGRGS